MGNALQQAGAHAAGLVSDTQTDGPDSLPPPSLRETDMKAITVETMVQTSMQDIQAKEVPGLQSVYDEMVECIWSRDARPVWPKWDTSSTNPTTVASIYETFEQTIIKSLASDTMQLLQRAIPKAFEKTFSWIFQDVPPCSLEEGEKTEWPNFPAWLRAKDVEEPYWVTGKPGSGKSTLMVSPCTTPPSRNICIYGQGTPRCLSQATTPGSPGLICKGRAKG